MNEEIKEILNQLEYFNEENYKYYSDFKLNRNQIKQLLDYITNLQEKVDQYENPEDMTLFYMWLDVKAKDKMKELQEDNKQLKELCNKYEEEHKTTFEEWKKDRKELLDKRSRINKAIELIKDEGLYEEDTNTFCGEIYSSLPELLNILQGVDKE